MSSHFVFGSTWWSRRTVMSILAGGITTLTSLSALSRAAQAEAVAPWRHWSDVIHCSTL